MHACLFEDRARTEDNAVEEQTRNFSNFPVRGIFKNPREIIVNMIEICLKITFIFINGHDFQFGIKSVCDECKNNGFFLYIGKS